MRRGRVVIQGLGIFASIGLMLINVDSVPLLAEDAIIVAQADGSGSRRRLPRGRSRAIPETSDASSAERIPTEPAPPSIELEEPSAPAIEESPKIPTVEVEPVDTSPVVPTTQPEQLTPPLDSETPPVQEVEIPKVMTEPETIAPAEAMEQAPILPTTQPDEVAPPTTIETLPIQEVESPPTVTEPEIVAPASVESKPLEQAPATPITQPKMVVPPPVNSTPPFREVETPPAMTEPELSAPTLLENKSLEQAPVVPTTRPEEIVPPPVNATPLVEEADIQPAQPTPAIQPVDSPPASRRLPSGRSRSTVERPVPRAQPQEVAGQAPSRAQIDEFQRSNFIPIRDRWRIGYANNFLDPYAQNVLKGDYAIIGQNIFLNVIGISESLFEARNVPTPKGISRARESGGEFFGRGRQLFFNQNLVASIEVFQGSTGFKPRDWAVRFTPVFNYNYLDVEERNIVNLDIREGTNRSDYQLAIQEAFVEAKLWDLSPRFDFISMRLGIQGFTSDFRGFIFADNAPGVRFFGNFLNNRYQWNIAYFNLLEKDTNSMLNSLEIRNRRVIVANIYKQDFIFKGYTTQFSFHYDRDVAGDKDEGGAGGQQFDRNGFIVRPARLGTLRPHNVHAYYLGWTGDGHMGRWNISHAFYQVFGKSTFDPVVGQDVKINAQLAALEVSYDIDWWRPKVSVFYASGDRNPVDDTARGFDSILDNVNFAGNGFSYFNRQGFLLSATGVFLNNRFSLLNDLRSSKIQGQSQFTNPGVVLVNGGVDIEATPKLKVLLNYSYLWFASTATLEFVLHREDLRQSIGHDASFGFIYRPLLNQNIVLNGGLAFLFPTGGLEDIQGDKGLYSAFFSAAFTF